MIKITSSIIKVCQTPDVIHFDILSAAIICIVDARTQVGGAVVVPETSYLRAKTLVADLIQKIQQGSGSQDTSSLEIKIAGSGVGVDVLRRTVAELKLTVKGYHIGKPDSRVVGFYYTDTGRLRIQTEMDRRMADRGPGPEGERRRKKRVLIVDDSKVIRDILQHIMKLDSELEVVGEADTPSQVEGLIEKLKPDVITLDINMPEMDGVTLLTKLLPKYPLPVVMISSVSMEEGTQVLRALEIGAVDYIQKPTFAELEEVGPQIAERVRLAASVKIKKRSRSIEKSTKTEVEKGLSQSTVIAIGSSTGGTEALRTIFMQLPPNIPPVVVVQHIPPVFSAAFAKRLNELCPFEVKEAENGDVVRAGRVLIAPGGKQMKLVGQNGDFKVKITDDPPVNRHKPSVDVLFDSVVECGASRSTIGVILTGMGGDGSKGLLKMLKQGSKTIAQDEASCVVFGMPKEAIRLGAADQILPLDDIPEALLKLLRR